VPPAPAARDAELGELLDDALAALPRHYRTTLLLCCCEGKSNEEAAQALGCALPTVKSRLARGREMMRRRLLRRGLAVPATALAAMLPNSLAAAAVPPSLLQCTIAAALAFARSAAAASRAAALAMGILRGLWVARVQVWIAVLLGSGLLVAGLVSTLAFFGQPATHAAPPAKDPQAAGLGQDLKVPAADPKRPGVNSPGGGPLEAPLPAVALARLGTTRFRAAGMVGYLKLSPDGKRLVTINENGILLWDAVTGKMLRSFPHNAWPMAAAVSLDGRRLLTQTTALLNVWDISSGKLIRAVEGSAGIGTFALAPDDRTLALEFTAPDGLAADGTAMYQSRLELRDLESDRVLFKFGKQRSFAPMGWLLFAADGKSLYAISSMNPRPEVFGKATSTVRCFDCATAELKSEKRIGGLSYFTALVSDGKLSIATGANVLDLATGKLRYTASGKDGPLSIGGLLPDGKSALVIIPAKNGVVEKDGATYVTEIEPTRLLLWDLAANKALRRLPSYLYGNPMAIDGRICLIVTNVYGAMQRWDLDTGKPLQPTGFPLESARLFGFSPDRELLAAADLSTLRVWQWRTGKQVFETPLDAGQHLVFLTFTPDGKALLRGGGLQFVATDTTTWKQVKHELEGFAPGPAGMATAELSPDGKTLAMPTTLWDWKSGKRTGFLMRQENDLIHAGPMSFSADCRWLATSAYKLRHGPDGQPLQTPVRIQIWNLADRKLLRDWETTEPHLMTLQVAKGGQTVVGGFHNGTVCVWDAATGKERLRFKHPHESPTNIFIRISTDGKLAATAHFHASPVLLWDLASGKKVGEVRGHLGGIHGLAFSRDGALLVSSAADTTVLIVDVRKAIGQ
jgi:WD40 repeat protein